MKRKGERINEMARKTRKDYPENWEEISLSIKERDNWMCQDCLLPFGAGNTKLTVNHKFLVLTVHHKDRDTMNSDPANLETLCSACHLRKEGPLIRREKFEKKHKDQLSFKFPGT